MSTTIRVSTEARNFLNQMAAEMTIKAEGKHSYTAADALDELIEIRKRAENRSGNESPSEPKAR